MTGYTEKQRDDLRQAIASGVLTVESPDSGRVTYRSMAEMERALARVEQGLAAQGASAIAPRRPVRRVVLTARSGF